MFFKIKKMKLLTLLLVFLICSIRAEESNESNDDEVDYRLNDDILPSHYEIGITPYLTEDELENEEQFTFDGKVKIWLQSTRLNVKEIVLHAANLTITNVQLLMMLEAQPKKITITASVPDPETGKFSIRLFRPMVPEMDYVLKITYSGIIGGEREGLYRGSYENEDGEIEYLAVTQLEPIHARKVFPCFDEPKFKATFRVQINRNNDYTSYSNTQLDYSVPIESQNRTIDVFKKTPLMSTYTLAMLIVDDIEERSKDEMLSILVMKKDYDNADYALELTSKILKNLDDFTDIPYSTMEGIEKLHMAAIPMHTGGAMENWGLVTFGKGALLCGKDCAERQKSSIATTVAHELAHMWFGNLVTCEWWSYTWLNEGIASYIEYYGIDGLISDAIEDTFYTLEQLVAFDIDSNEEFEAMRPLTDESVDTSKEIMRSFSGTSYSKGSTIMRMFDHMFGEEKFKAALRSYLKENAYKTVTPKELMNAFLEQWDNPDVDFEALFKDWTEQPGYPVVTIDLSDDKKSFQISQKIYVDEDDDDDDDEDDDKKDKDKKDDDDDDDKKDEKKDDDDDDDEKDEKKDDDDDDDDDNDQWIIPITFTTNVENDFENTSPDFYLQENEVRTVELDEPVEWIIGNVQQVGYYRVNYDTDTWIEIGEALKEENFGGIHVINRAQIIYDLLKFAEDGLVEYGLALEILEYLGKETEMVPWLVAFEYLEDILDYMDDNDEVLFKKYMQSLIENIYEDIDDDEGDEDFELAVAKAACFYGVENCVSKSLKLTDKYLHKNRKNPSKFEKAAFQVAVQENPKQYFDVLFENLKVESPDDLDVLACTTDGSDLVDLLNHLLVSKNKTELFTELFTITESECVLEEVFIDFIFDNIDELIERDTDKIMPMVLVYVAKIITTDEEYERLEKIVDENDDDDWADNLDTLKIVLNEAKENLRWKKKYGPAVSEYLNKKFGGDKEDDDDDDDDDVKSGKMKKSENLQINVNINAIVPKNFKVGTYKDSSNTTLTEIYVFMKQSIITSSPPQK